MIPPDLFDNLGSWFDRVREPLLLTHVRPDGDAIGAMVGTSWLLRQRGCTPRAVLFGPLGETYDLFRPAADWLNWDESRDVLGDSCDAVVILDTCALSQLEPALEYLRGAPPIAVVDHHATRDAIGERPGDLRLFDETAGATSLIICEWLQHAGLQPDRVTASALFAGIATDCGWFRFANTDNRMFQAAAHLASIGVDVGGLYRYIYQRDPLAKVRLVARMLSNLELLAGERLAVMRLRAADLAAAGADGRMTDNLVNEAGRLGSTLATLLFIEEPDGTIRVNLRSKEKLDVAALARRYGGGGHERTAGARLHGSWDQVVDRLVAETVEALETLAASDPS